jgi:hypothetical protein
MKISYKPAKELIILEMVNYSLEQIARTGVMLMDAGQPFILNWAHEVAFSHSPIPFRNKEFINERMKGRIYWASVVFARMPEYRSFLKVGAREIPVIATPNPYLQKVGAWLKERLDEAGTSGPFTFQVN